MESSITINYTINKRVHLTDYEKSKLVCLLNGFATKNDYFEYLSKVYNVNEKVIISMSEGLSTEYLFSKDFHKMVIKEA